jgi:hypothetical protein
VHVLQAGRALPKARCAAAFAGIAGSSSGLLRLNTGVSFRNVAPRLGQWRHGDCELTRGE